MLRSKKKVMIMILLVAVAGIHSIFWFINGQRNLEVKNSITYDISNYKLATFAGGCFWCMEPPFEKLEGVVDVISGYTGGDKVDPTYEEVSKGQTGHVEAVMVVYDEEMISYEELLDVFWMQINPTDAGGQFVDRGSSYTSGIFYYDEEQNRLAEKSKKEQEASNRFNEQIVTPIEKASDFYRAEEYHQDYYTKNPKRYNYYRSASGRDQYLDTIWGTDRGKDKNKNTREYSKPSEDELRKQLTPLQYNVTQQEGTEKPYENEYWESKEEGIYVDIVSGEPLFSSIDKYDSGTGWPSFTKPLQSKNIVEKEDRSLFGLRIEVRSKQGDSHLGHVFNDGPKPTGLRYCINSAALRFIRKEDLKKEGYEAFERLFKLN